MLINGTANSDTLKGTARADEIHGRGGNDTLYGLGGNDLLYGDGGDDFIRGGDGGDRIYGGIGIDRLNGDNGNDVLFGDAGNDTLIGGLGHDSLNGGLGDDTLWGGDGDDVLRDSQGYNQLFGGNGNDRIYSQGFADFYTNAEGGTGSDVFSFTARRDGSRSTFVIEDFVQGEDHLLFEVDTLNGSKIGAADVFTRLDINGDGKLDPSDGGDEFGSVFASTDPNSVVLGISDGAAIDWLWVFGATELSRSDWGLV